MIVLSETDQTQIRIRPRWPYKKVAVSEDAFAALHKVQENLAAHTIRLILTRGYEYENRWLKRAHAIFRSFCALIFAITFPTRRNECSEIFAPNGHDVHGDNLDIGIEYKGAKLNFLPMGVFTSSAAMDAIKAQYSDVLIKVEQALQVNGFKIHINHTEALQIHCVFVRKAS